MARALRLNLLASAVATVDRPDPGGPITAKRRGSLRLCEGWSAGRRTAFAAWKSAASVLAHSSFPEEVLTSYARALGVEQSAAGALFPHAVCMSSEAAG